MTKRTVEIFIAGCAACEEAVAAVTRIACESCAVSTVDMNRPEVARRARALGIRSVPAVVVNGKLAECCASGGPREDALRAAGVGQAM